MIGNRNMATAPTHGWARCGIPLQNIISSCSMAKPFRAPSPEESLGSFGSFSWDAQSNTYKSNRGFPLTQFQSAPEEAKTLSLTWDWRLRPGTESDRQRLSQQNRESDHYWAQHAE
jgi:hypothetical protein